MTNIWWHNLLDSYDISDVRNYSTAQDGTGAVSPDWAIIAADGGAGTITIAGDQTTFFRDLGQCYIKNNVGLGADSILSLNNAVLDTGNTVLTIDSDITGIDVTGEINRVSTTAVDDLRFDGTGTGASDDIQLRAPGGYPAADEVGSITIDNAYKGRLRAYNGIREVFIENDSQFSLPQGIDRRFGLDYEYTSGWSWSLSGTYTLDKTWTVGPASEDNMYTNSSHPYVIPNILNESDVNLTIARTDTAKELFTRAANDSVVCDTADIADNIEFDDVHLVMPLETGLKNLDVGKVDFLNSSVLYLGPLQFTQYSTDTVASDTLPTDPSQLWFPPVFFVHDWNSSFDLSESYQTSIRTAVNIEETRRGLVDKPFRVVNQDSQAWNDEELLLMQSMYNRNSSARSLQPLYCDMSFLLNEITPTTAPVDQTEYPDGVPIPDDGTVLVMNYSRMDIRYARFSRGMRVLIYNPVDQRSTRMITDFEINTIDRVWGVFDELKPDVFTTIWLGAAVSKTWPAGTRVIPLIETEVVFNTSAEVMNAEIGNFTINSSESVGESTLPSIVRGNALTSDGLNENIGQELYATWPVSLGSAQAPAAPVITPDTANYTVNPTRGFFRPGQFAHIGKGNIPQVYGSRILNEYDITATFIDRKSAWEFITMWQSRRGQLNRAYIISPWEDYTATALTGVSCTLNKNVDLIDFQVRAFIAFRLVNSEWLVRRVTGITDNGDTVTLIWTEPLPNGTTVDIDDLLCVRSAFLGRFSQDDCLQQWINLRTLEFTTKFQDLGPELDDDVTATAGLWAIDNTQGAGGYDVIKNDGSFTNSLDSITVDTDPFYGTMEDVAREKLDFEIDTNSTCIGTNVFWPLDEVFEILKVINYQINFEGVSYIDIGMGENTGCTVNNYDYNDFVVRVYLSFKEALWLRRDKGVLPADPVCLPPEENLWAMLDYTQEIWVSWSSAGFNIPDYGPQGFPMLFYNPDANDVDETRIVPVLGQVSVPDGIGLAAMQNPQSLINRIAEKWFADSSAEMSLLITDAYSFGGWFMMNWLLNGFKKNYVMASAGRYWNGDWGIPVANSLRVVGFVDDTLDPPMCSFGVFTSFNTSGIAQIETDAVYPHDKWYHIWVQQTDTTIELWVDGVLAKSSSPVGASGIDINDDYPFRLFGSGIILGLAGVSWRGGIGDDFPFYNSVLNQAGVTAKFRSAPNFDYTTKTLLSDVGAIGSPYSLNTNEANARAIWNNDPLLKTYTYLPNTGSNSSLLNKPIYPNGQKVEIQFLLDAQSADGGMLMGFTGGPYGFASGLNSGAWLGKFTGQMGYFTNSGSLYYDNVLQAGTPVALPALSTMAIRLDTDLNTFTFLIDNVIARSGTLPADIYDQYGAIFFALGCAYNSPDNQGKVTILSKASDFTFPIAAGHIAPASV